MFEWLDEELRAVRTPHFHEVDGPAPRELRRAVKESDRPLPPSYKEFVIRFGNARLYRCSNWYKIEIYASPRDATSESAETLTNFGRIPGALAYFKDDLLVEGTESAVFEWHGPEFGFRQAANGFEQWLEKKHRAARRSFSKSKWQSILAGPAPFSKEEKAVVEARRHFHWRVIGIAENGDLQFEVKNRSNMALPYLTIGIRRKGGEPFGGVKLPVSGIQPGSGAVVEVDCYKQSHAPEDVEPFEKPDPEPALRDLYWEFKQMPRTENSSE
ncbi:MAG TPA: hypothetical protein VNH11_21440 [Pirellulales bacterium]|nr:hypothetical protein [Pirellulales bacterium]